MRLSTAVALYVALAATIGAGAAPPAQSLRVTCRVDKSVEPGTKIRVKMRSKYVHLSDPKDIPRGGYVGVGEENEVFVIWAKETLTWEFEVPKSGRVPDRLFTFTYEGALPPPPPQAYDGIFFPIEWTVVYPAPVAGKRETDAMTFGQPKPTKPQDWTACLRVRKSADGTHFSISPTCDTVPQGGITIPR